MFGFSYFISSFLFSYFYLKLNNLQQENCYGGVCSLTASVVLLGWHCWADWRWKKLDNVSAVSNY